MYLVKNLKVPSQQPRINLNDYIDKFSFVPFLHPDRRSEFQDRIKEYIPNISDIVASIVTKLFTQRPNDKLILEAMSCCQSILHSRGYETLIDKDLRKEAALSRRYVRISDCSLGMSNERVTSQPCQCCN